MSPSEKICFFVIGKLSAKERQSAELNRLYIFDNVCAGLLKYCQGGLNELIVTVYKKCYVLSFFLIKLIAKNPAKEMEYSEIKEEIKAGLLSEKRRKAYESKINQLKIMYPVDMNAL